MQFERVNWHLLGLSSVAAVSGACVLWRVLHRPSRPFETVNTVGVEYDKWTTDGILEHFWGEHIHLGYYDVENRSWFSRSACFITNFISATMSCNFVNSFKQAKYVFVSELMKWSGVSAASGSGNIKFLDVGCGIGGTTRFVAQQNPDWSVVGISISPKQIERASELATSRKLPNAKFQVCDAMNMSFANDSFDIVWSCESAEHMPDKEGFLKECYRVLKPGGQFVLATWCQRDDSKKPFTEKERSQLDFLYKEWCHPRFASIQEYSSICDKIGFCSIKTTDWTEPTLPSWRHSIFVGIWSPWAVILRPTCWWSTIREIVTLERMHCAFRDGLMDYGILVAQKQ